MKKIHISHVGNEHNRWLRALEFYKTEIGIQKNLLTEVASKNSGSDMLREVEHFENAFKVQIDNIDRIAHDIHVNLDSISNAAQHANAGYIDGALVEQHDAIGARYETEEKLANELIQGFRRFVEKWM